MEFHTQFSGRVRVPEVNEEPSRTHQSFKDEVDVNNIVKRHTDGRIPLPSVGMIYQDVSELTDYRDAIDNVKRVTEIFMSLPATSRAYFNHDAAAFLDWSFENDAAAVDALVHGPPRVAEVIDVPATTAPVGPAEGEDPPITPGDS